MPVLAGMQTFDSAAFCKTVLRRMIRAHVHFAIRVGCAGQDGGAEAGGDAGGRRGGAAGGGHSSSGRAVHSLGGCLPGRPMRPQPTCTGALPSTQHLSENQLINTHLPFRHFCASERVCSGEFRANVTFYTDLRATVK